MPVLYQNRLSASPPHPGVLVQRVKGQLPPRSRMLPRPDWDSTCLEVTAERSTATGPTTARVGSRRRGTLWRRYVLWSCGWSSRRANALVTLSRSSSVKTGLSSIRSQYRISIMAL